MAKEGRLYDLLEQRKKLDEQIREEIEKQNEGLRLLGYETIQIGEQPKKSEATYCAICDFKTIGGQHDGRTHRFQTQGINPTTEKAKFNKARKPFTDDDLKRLGLTKVK